MGQNLYLKQKSANIDYQGKQFARNFAEEQETILEEINRNRLTANKKEKSEGQPISRILS